MDKHSNLTKNILAILFVIFIYIFMFLSNPAKTLKNNIKNIKESDEPVNCKRSIK